ncbi:hypothetical protein K8640_17355 [Myxococcus sp. XM-1-1-1]|uniref:hypothetical protein n=1 Tax=Myxococcus sp. XM-1-1-1 TaxID=2874602 RepID=UPI001D3B9939|nr:hypothetical protein [Myxococcus sp. XM-1-1-1]MBZ4409975.1 hypothetical protein [Myxococcus sp. XM-1-1-1]BDT36955.1 hypothetical protein MFMH1_66240 [Myxococcus sp. MH1]
MGQARRKEKEKQESPPEPSPGQEPLAQGAWVKPEGLSRRGWAVLVGLIVVIQFPLIHYVLFRGDAEVTATIPYTQDFSDPGVVKRDFFTTGGYWRVIQGELLAPGVKNNPLWLQAPLPDDVAVELDVRSELPEGDIRVELFGNGVDPASGYVLMQGGQNNSVSAIARLDLNAPTLDALQRRAQRKAESSGAAADLASVFKDDTRVKVEARGTPVQAGRTYHWRIERRGTLLRWSIDGELFLELDDPRPLKGPGHDRLGLSGFESQIFWDNLRVDTPDRLPAKVAAVTPAIPPGPYADDFERDTLGDAWNVTNPTATRIVDGALVVEQLHNRPVWLKRPLPRDAVIEFDAWTDSPQGDIKVEAWGDGRSFYAGDLRLQYTATGYVFIFGGWKNTQSAIARRSEHTPDRVTRDGAAVVPGKRHHFKLTRRGDTLAWELDGQPFLTLKDATPLEGSRNQYFGFSGWQTRVHFDNLKIEPLAP